MAQGLTPDPCGKAICCFPVNSISCSTAPGTGKSTTVAAIALNQLLTQHGSLVLLVAPAERQSHELFRKVIHAYLLLNQPIPSTCFNRRANSN